MTIPVKIKGWFLSFFRENFLYHHSSLEFRAKLLAAMIAVDKKVDDCEEKILKEIAKEIYKDDEARIYVLISTTKEYVEKIIQKNGLDLNELILHINKDLKEAKRFHQKIDIKQLEKLLICSKDDEEKYLTQKRIIEFLQNQIDEYKS